MTCAATAEARSCSEANRFEAEPNTNLDLTSSRGEEATERSRGEEEADHDLDPMARRATGEEVDDDDTACRFGVEAIRLSAAAAAVVEAIVTHAVFRRNSEDSWDFRMRVEWVPLRSMMGPAYLSCEVHDGGHQRADVVIYI